MIKLIISKTDEYSNYSLKDKNEKEYNLNINFMGIKKPEVGAEIYIPEPVINENVSLNYGIIDEEKKANAVELMVISYQGDKKYLQRYYG